ncbi:MAG TPA: methyltransferase domain-containing protein [Alphaproteobacteria bacterium]|nr:methyltransferase domain-containing protein [Alphaproteobacteria bacterium]
MKDDVDAARRWFAEELRYTARVQSPAVVKAFATVKREHFAGPGPWRLLSPVRTTDYWTTESADPAHLYHDVLVAIDEERRLNNGQPSLWASLFDQLGLSPGEHVVHIGTGTGYYTAILAETVGPTGHVTGVEIDPHLAERTRQNLALHWPQTAIVTANGFTYRPDRPADAIVVNAGVSHLSLIWLDALAPENGRLLVPLTISEGVGAFLLITRQRGETRRYAAQFAGRTGIIDCVGGRNAEAEERLKAALRVSYFTAVRSLRRPPEEPNDTCWLAGDGWWFSTAPM